MPQRRILAAILLFSLTGCRLPEDEWGIVDAVWNDFPWWSIIWRLVVWATFGAVIGLGIGIVVTLFLRRLGAYRLPWPRVGFWLRVTIFALNFIAMPILFGTIGLLEGTYFAGEVAIRQSKIGKTWLPMIAEVGADAIATADLMLENDDARIDHWNAVHEQKRSVNVPRMLGRLDKLQGDAAKRISEKAKDALFEDNPDWKGDVTEGIVDWTLPPLINYLLNRKLHGKLAEYGVPDFLSEMRGAAVKDGDELMTHKEMTDFLTDRVLIRIVLYPLRKWATSTQWTTLAIVAAWFATPVLLMGITRWINFLWKRRRNRKLCTDRL